MFFSDLITLRVETGTKDTDGYPATPTNVDTSVWANAKSVVRSEFYAANANNIDASIAFEIHSEDYASQRVVIYDSKTYDVLRAYQKGLGVIELTCTDRRR